MITGSQVETMAPLVRLEPVSDETAVVEEVAATGPGLELPPVPEITDPEARANRLLSDLSALVMGFDADPEYRPLAGYLSTRDEL